jgi:peroxiredoxin-like protein
MQDFPHHYFVTATGAVAGAVDGDVALSADALPVLHSAPPVEFGGPGTRWSPETLLVAAVGDCFILTFRAVARASKLAWASLACDVAGTLDRVDRTVRFTRFDVHARLTVPAETDRDQARRVVEKAERSCMITNSLNGDVHLSLDVDVTAPVPCDVC